MHNIDGAMAARRQMVKVAVLLPSPFLHMRLATLL
jgi:hypothetical protein